MWWVTNEMISSFKQISFPMTRLVHEWHVEWLTRLIQAKQRRKVLYNTKIEKNLIHCTKCKSERNICRRKYNQPKDNKSIGGGL